MTSFWMISLRSFRYREGRIAGREFKLYLYVTLVTWKVSSRVPRAGLVLLYFLKDDSTSMMLSTCISPASNLHLTYSSPTSHLHLICILIVLVEPHSGVTCQYAQRHNEG